ncbi:MAG: SRPBCC domain-containing protein [Rhodospirillales bacterium]|nr:SRPBCC domain-containing protein [Rhodospirillales bacterium]
MKLAVRSAGFELVMQAEFAAPRETVFAAWTDRRLLARWWAARTYTTLSCELDVRPGGAWRRLLRRPNGTVLIEYGTYREVVPPERLVFTYNSEGSDLVEPETVVTVLLTRLGDRRTRLTLRHAGIETDAAHAIHEAGWSRCFDRFSTTLSEK